MSGDPFFSERNQESVLKKIRKASFLVKENRKIESSKVFPEGIRLVSACGLHTQVHLHDFVKLGYKSCCYSTTAARATWVGPDFTSWAGPNCRMPTTGGVHLLACRPLFPNKKRSMTTPFLCRSFHVRHTSFPVFP
jgi:hypothetical protein